MKEPGGKKRKVAMAEEKADEGEEVVQGVWSRLLSAASMKEQKAETCNLLVIGNSSDAISRRIVRATDSGSSSGDSTEEEVNATLPLKYYHVKLIHPDDAATVEDREEAPDCNIWSLDDFERQACAA